MPGGVQHAIWENPLWLCRSCLPTQSRHRIQDRDAPKLPSRWKEAERFDHYHGHSSVLPFFLGPSGDLLFGRFMEAARRC